MSGAFGPRVIDEQQWEEEQQVIAENRHVFGPRVIGSPQVGDPPDPAEHFGSLVQEREVAQEAASITPEVWLSSARGAKKMVRESDDAEELKVWHTQEEEHPKYEGGRSGVLNAIEDRIGELEIEESE